MARSHRTCVHCLRAPGSTDDHGVPKSWYPTESAPNVKRVKAPACVPCNQALKKVEEQVLIPLALSLDPTDPRCAGVVARVLRSMDPSQGKDDRDRRARAALRRRVQAQVFAPATNVGEFPGCGPVPGGTGHAMPLSAALVRRLAEKLTRVVYWSEYGDYIGPGYTVQTHVVRRGPDEARVAALVRGGQRIEVPPGIYIAVRKADDDPTTGVLVIDLWGKIRLFTSVEPVVWRAGAQQPAQSVESN